MHSTFRSARRTEVKMLLFKDDADRMTHCAVPGCRCNALAGPTAWESIRWEIDAGGTVQMKAQVELRI